MKIQWSKYYYTACAIAGLCRNVYSPKPPNAKRSNRHQRACCAARLALLPPATWWRHLHLFRISAFSWRRQEHPHLSAHSTVLNPSARVFISHKIIAASSWHRIWVRFVFLQQHIDVFWIVSAWSKYAMPSVVVAADSTNCTHELRFEVLPCIRWAPSMWKRSMWSSVQEAC